MTRLCFWNLFPQIRLEALLCNQPKKYCLRHISSYVNSNTQTVWCVDKTVCKLLRNKQKTGQCLQGSRMLSFLTNNNFRLNPSSRFTDAVTVSPLNTKHDIDSGHYHELLLIRTCQLQQTREYKSKKREEDSSSSEDEYEESDVEDEEYDFPLGYKEKKAFVKSLRADAIVSSGLALSRNSVDDIFLKSCLRLNGAKLLKKSKLLVEEDYIDVILERKDDKLRIKRVKLLKVLPELTQKERLAVKLRVWKTSFEIDDEDKQQW